MLKESTIEKNIWIFWYQGWDKAPYLIKECRDSWIKNNPSWKIHLLDIFSIKEFLDFKLDERFLSHLSIAHLSDLIRLELLEKFGGIWVDASLFCLIPLDHWIYKYLKSGIFLFESNTRLTIIANWFIAAKSKHITIILLKKNLLEYWEKNNFKKINLWRRILRKVFNPLLNFNIFTARLWFNPIFTKIIKIYPYQIFYFMFENILKSNKLQKSIWEKTPKLNKYICWPYQDENENISKELIKRIENEFVPILKLNWRGYRKNNLSKDSLLNYLKNIN